MGKLDPNVQRQKQSDPAGTAVPDSAATETHAGSAQPSRRRPSYSFLAPARSPDEVGWLGPYRILDVLGEGAMGVVFRAEKPPLKRALALKVMRPDSACPDDGRKRFLREAQAAAGLHHDHIIPIFDYGEDDGVQYLAMPLLPGKTLLERMRRQDGTGDSPMSIPEVIRIGREIAEGLAAAHAQQLVHRDIKPANLWLETLDQKGSSPASRKDSSFRVRILDFGLARGPDDSVLTLPGAIVGTPKYMAPEQVRGEPAEERSDLFSLGAVLYLITTGEAPFPGNNFPAVLASVLDHQPPEPAKLRPDVPRTLSRLIMRLLEKDMRDRPWSAAEVAAAFTAMERGESLTGTFIEPLPVRQRCCNVRRIVSVLLGALALAGGIWLWTELAKPSSSVTPATPKADGDKPLEPVEPDKKKSTEIPEGDPGTIPSKKGVIDDE